jgi:hypothetical protein
MADDELRRPAYAKRSLMELVTNSAPPVPPAAAAVPLVVPEEPDYSPPPKKSDPLPKPGDRYRPYARFVNRVSEEQKYIHFIHGDFIRIGFAYHDLRRITLVDGDRPGVGRSLVLRFTEAVVTDVTLTGGEILDDLEYYISEWWMPWVWEQPKGFKPSGGLAMAITSITFHEFEK